MTMIRQGAQMTNYFTHARNTASGQKELPIGAATPSGRLEFRTQRRTFHGYNDMSLAVQFSLDVKHG